MRTRETTSSLSLDHDQTHPVDDCSPPRRRELLARRAARCRCRRLDHAHSDVYDHWWHRSRAALPSRTSVAPLLVALLLAWSKAAVAQTITVSANPAALKITAAVAGSEPI